MSGLEDRAVEAQNGADERAAVFRTEQQSREAEKAVEERAIQALQAAMKNKLLRLVREFVDMARKYGEPLEYFSGGHFKGSHPGFRGWKITESNGRTVSNIVCGIAVSESGELYCFIGRNEIWYTTGGPLYPWFYGELKPGRYQGELRGVVQDSVITEEKIFKAAQGLVARARERAEKER